MAQAGFVWTPVHPGDDLATCLYCNISLSGWEEGDDPMSVSCAFSNRTKLTSPREEHRKRLKSGTTCPFLVYSPSAGGPSATTPPAPASPPTNKLTRSTSAKPASKAHAKPPSRSRSSRPARGHKEPAKENDILEEEEEDSRAEEETSDSVPVKLVTKPAGAKKTRKTSRAPSARPSTRGVTRAASQQPVSDTYAQQAKGRSQGRGARALKDVVEEAESSDELGMRVTEEGEEEEEEVEEARPRPAASRSRASRAPRKQPKAQGKSTSRRPLEEAGESEDVAVGAPIAKSGKSRKGRVVEDTDEDEPEDAAPVRSQSRTTSRKGGGKAASRSKKSEQSQEAVAVGGKTKRQTSRRVEREESATEVTEGEGNATGYGMSEEEGGYPAASRSRSGAKTGKRSSKSTVANASRGKKAGNAVKRAPERVEEETVNEDDIVLPTQDQSERDEEDVTPAPGKSRGKSTASSRKKNQVSSTDEVEKQKSRQIVGEYTGSNEVNREEGETVQRTSIQDQSGEDEEEMAAPLSRSRVPGNSGKARGEPMASSQKDEASARDKAERLMSKDEEENTVGLSKRVLVGDQEGERTPVPRHLISISTEKFKPVRSPRKEETRTPGNGAKPVVYKVPQTTVETDDKCNKSDRTRQPPSKAHAATTPTTASDTATTTAHQDMEIEETNISAAKKTLVENDSKHRYPSDIEMVEAQTIPDEPIAATRDVDIPETDTTVEPPEDVHMDDGPDQRMSILKKTPPPSEPLAPNFDKIPIVEKRAASMHDQPPQLTGRAVKTPSPPPAPPAAAVKATTPEAQILPALSRIPYLPLQTLTDAELEMTVEEWIRYQMEIEYDKLKRDGERELARFKARAEEARKIIEGL